MQVSGQLGHLIETAMKRRKPPVTVPWLAKHTGMSTTALYNIISGTTKRPTQATLTRIADALVTVTGAQLWDAAAADQRPSNNLSIVELEDGVWAGWTNQIITLTRSMDPATRDALRKNIADFVEFQAMKDQEQREEPEIVGGTVTGISLRPVN